MRPRIFISFVFVVVLLAEQFLVAEGIATTGQ